MKLSDAMLLEENASYWGRTLDEVRKLEAVAEGMRHIKKWSEQPSGALRPAQILHAVRRMCDDALADLEVPDAK